MLHLLYTLWLIAVAAGGAVVLAVAGWALVARRAAHATPMAGGWLVGTPLAVSSRTRGVFRPRSSGNAAFDAWRATELSRLEDERRALEIRHREFADFLDDLRRAKDRETFDRFMREYASVRRADADASAPPTTEGSSPPWWRTARATPAT